MKTILSTTVLKFTQHLHRPAIQLEFSKILALILAAIFLSSCPKLPVSIAQEGQAEIESSDALIPNNSPIGYWLQVPVPLSEATERRLRLQISQISQNSRGDRRPVAVLELIDNSNPSDETSAIGAGTEFERALSIARFLGNQIGNRVRTVAYLKQPLEGHAVLIALGCEEIAAAPKAELGRATRDELHLDKVMVDGYLAIASRRAHIPADAVQSMLDPSFELYRIETNQSETLFVTNPNLEPLRNQGQVIRETLVSIPNQLGNFNGQEMRNWLWTTYLPQDPDQLRELLDVASWERNQRTFAAGPTIPALIEIRGAVTTASVNRWLRNIDEAIERNQANLIFFHIQSPGGSLAESVRIAQRIAELDESGIESIAWVDGQARGDAWLIAAVADQLFVHPRSVLGGYGEATIAPSDIVDLNPVWIELSNKTDRNPGQLYAPISPDLEIQEFLSPRGKTEIGATDLFQQRPDAPNWRPNKVISFKNGLDPQQAVLDQWATGLANDLNEVAAQRGLEKMPEPKRISIIEQWVQEIANKEWLATFLLFLGFSLFMNELFSPGLSVAGFGALLCFTLFFWMQFMNGTVEWLEILLCLGGILAIAIELFIIPGFGIFGIGGFLMLASGLVLASQTFIVPTNDYQWNAMAWHILRLAIACCGLLIMLYVFRNQIDKLPFFRWMRLAPPEAEAVAAPETSSMAALVGMTGITTSRCTPFGKALLNGQYYDVQSPNDFVEADTKIVVKRIRGDTLVIQKLHDEPLSD